MQIWTETYTGSDGVEMPRRFRFDDREIDVVDNLDQWHGLDYRYFKVRGNDGNLYVLRFNESRADWELTMFERAPSQAAPASSHASRRADRGV